MALSTVVAQGRVAATDDLLSVSVRQLDQLATSDRVPDVLQASEPGEVVQLLDAEGRVLATSSSASRTLPLVGSDELDGLGPSVTARTVESSPYGSGPTRVAALPTTVDGAPATAVAGLPLREVEGVVAALRISLLVVVPLLTLALGLVIWSVLGRVLRPVEELRLGAERVRDVGGPGSLPVPAVDDELAALARTLNSMLDRLDASAARQNAFVADAAHELRSPVAALRATIDVARTHPDAYSATELAADLAVETARLGELVEDLLVLAKVGSSGSSVRPSEEVDLAVTAREIAREVLAGAADRTTGREGEGEAEGGAEIRVEVEGRVVAELDPTATRRILRNLVDNAVRHAGTVVTVALSELPSAPTTAGTRSAVRIVVDDDGPGVPEGERERVFERFARLASSRGRDSGGTGLGLPIARALAREHGGDVSLSTSPAGGLRAEATLAVRPPAAAGPRSTVR
ncbi:two-component sensor histidine kinase [Paraoerskovia sediminicola]|uniref:histidine kinase n=1 Tax=Paraoerskovia sediminicola TaxID=1138587 RepID=A0ABM8FYZ2_9CELL|nr:two-component sensor histidine kinase [Paraoerskovia sediminicola]